MKENIIDKSTVKEIYNQLVNVGDEIEVKCFNYREFMWSIYYIKYKNKFERNFTTKYLGKKRIKITRIK